MPATNAMQALTALVALLRRAPRAITRVAALVYAISRTYRGVTIRARPDRELPAGVRLTFLHAVMTLSHLVPLTKTLTDVEWRERITRVYEKNSRITELLGAIKVAMGSNAVASEPAEPHGSEVERPRAPGLIERECIDLTIGAGG